MPRRIQEEQNQVFTGIENARAYAKQARSPMMQRGYGVIVERISRLGVKGRYLEIGSGPAILTAMIAQALPQAHITAVELEPDMLTVAQEEVEKEGLADRINLLEGDAADVGLLDQLGQFDLVYSTYSLHHWDQPQRVIENLLRAVAPGGALFIHDLKRVWWLYWIPVRSGFILSIKAAYTPAEIRDLLTNMGIERFEIQNGLFYQSVIIET